MPILWPLKVPERGNAITTQPGHYRFFLIPQKIPIQIKLPKTILAKFPYPKNPGIENFKTKKILRSSPSIEILSPPPPGFVNPAIKLKLVSIFPETTLYP